MALEIGVRDVGTLDPNLIGRAPGHKKSLAFDITRRAIRTNTRRVFEVSAIHETTLKFLLNISTVFSSKVLVLVRLYPLHGSCGEAFVGQRLELRSVYRDSCIE